MMTDCCWRPDNVNRPPLLNLDPQLPFLAIFPGVKISDFVTKDPPPPPPPGPGSASRNPLRTLFISGLLNSYLVPSQTPTTFPSVLVYIGHHSCLLHAT